MGRGRGPEGPRPPPAPLRGPHHHCRLPFREVRG
nr:MAG TPA: hypothetical protein [Caudoviricetes sp.]